MTTLGAIQVKADLLIDVGPGSFTQSFAPGNYVAGSEFTTVTPFTIRSLGYLDAEGNGLVQSHFVGLWGSGQNLLASVTVLPTSPTVLSAQGTAVWYMVNIPALVIGPGTYRVAGSQTADSAARSNFRIGNGVTISSGYVRTDFPNGGFGFPDLTFGSNAVRATLSTDSFGTSVVPEPSSITLAGLACAALITVRSRRRRA